MTYPFNLSRGAAEMMRAVVIGGAGFIGAYVVRALAERGCAVAVVARGDAPVRLPAGVRQLSFAEAAAAPFPDLVVHMAAMSEPDAQRAADAFEGKAGRLVAASSGDVYLAYGRFTGLEPGPPVPVPLSEEAPLRTRLFPYRASATSEADPLFHYEKILVERALLGRSRLNAAIVRLPKVYGPEKNADFATVHAYADRPDWRWTHGYVGNAAAAIALLGLHRSLPRPIYNVGEAYTPTVAERLRDLLPSPIPPSRDSRFDFRQDLWLDTSAIRADFGFVEPVSYAEGLRRTLPGG